ncbi:hypothetical protein [Nesterenkonia alba]|uniref:hypothetical protein n=1 Tax=Nesterenkonia alba TaxID=515814 RepID=UPI0003B760F7|nr:hypothetical protein [Nesterenkonia alba]
MEIVGAKQLYAGMGEDRLVNVGLYLTASSEVVSLNEPKELDQGQYDGRDAVSAVAAHGMLVSARLFGALGGFAPWLSGDYAAADFCTRARQAGAQVVIEPAARMYRSDPPTRQTVHRLGGALYLPAEQRRSQIITRLARAHLAAIPLVWLGQWVLALVRCLALIACKAPEAGFGQVASSAHGLLNWVAIARLRRMMTRGPRRFEPLPADPVPGAVLRRQRRRDLTAETVAPQIRRVAEEDAGLLDVATGDGEFDEMPARRSEDRLGLFVVLTALTGVSLIGFRELLTTPVLGGGAALPASPSVSEALYQTVSFLTADSLGERSAADPFALVVLVLSLLSAGHASTVLLWVVILAAPLAALTAWWAAGLWSPRAFHRVLAALIWALLPVLHTAAGQGRIGTVMAHILLPVVVVLAVHALRRRRERTGGLEPAAGAGLVLALLCASAPILLVPAVVFCVLAASLLGRPGRIFWLLPAPALAIFIPTVFSTLDRGSQLAAVLLGEPGRTLSAAEAGLPAPLWQQLLGFSVAFDPVAGLPGASAEGAWLPAVLDGDFWGLRLALLIGGPLLVIALIGLIAAGRRRLLLVAGTTAAGTGFYSAVVTGVATGRIGDELVAAHPGPLVSVLVLCLLAAALAALDTAHVDLGGLFSPVASTLLVIAIFATAVLWAAPRLLPVSPLDERTITAVNHHPVLISPGSHRHVPVSAADAAEGPDSTRTLVLGIDNGTVTAELVSGQGVMLDAVRTPVTAQGLPLRADAEYTDEHSASQQRLAELTAAVVTPGAEDLEDLLRELAVGFILIPEGETPLTDAADVAAGLISVGPTDRGLLWRAEDEDIAWARLIDGEGNQLSTVASDDRRIHGTTLTLPEEAEFLELATERAGGWRGEFNGEQLRPTTESSTGDEELPWMRRFHLPQGEHQGTLEVSHRSDYQYPLLTAVGLMLLVLILIAVPLPRSWRILPVATTAQLEGRRS